MLSRVSEAAGKRVAQWVEAYDPFTNVYGAARSILALSTMLTLIFSRSDVLFRPAAGISDFPVCNGVRAAGAFCLGGQDHLGVVRWAFVIALFVIALGWRPRFTGLLHAWVAFSLQANAITIEGGDQISAILTLLLVPVTLCDDRTWHWLPRTPRKVDQHERMIRLIARTCFLLIRVQVAGIYFHASIGKFAVAEWTDGTVLYYWLNHPSFGAPEWILPLLRPLLLNSLFVAGLTWSVLILEWVLSAGLLVARRYWPILLVAGIALHTGIAFLHGLVSFGITMTAALVLYLRPLDQPWSTGRVFELLRGMRIRTLRPVASLRQLATGLFS